MARPRKRINQGLPQGLVCRNRKRADGSIVVYYYYTMADKKEVALGKDKHIAILEAAKLNMQYLTKKDNILFIEVLERYEKEVVPLKKAKNTRSQNVQILQHQFLINKISLLYICNIVYFRNFTYFSETTKVTGL